MSLKALMARPISSSRRSTTRAVKSPAESSVRPLVSCWMGRLMRTSYVPKYEKIYSEYKKADVWYRAEIRIYDEIDKANSTMVVIKSVDLNSLPENIFTKA